MSYVSYNVSINDYREFEITKLVKKLHLKYISFFSFETNCLSRMRQDGISRHFIHLNLSISYTHTHTHPHTHTNTLYLLPGLLQKRVERPFGLYGFISHWRGWLTSPLIISCSAEESVTNLKLAQLLRNSKLLCCCSLEIRLFLPENYVIRGRP